MRGFAPTGFATIHAEIPPDSDGLPWNRLPGGSDSMSRGSSSLLEATLGGHAYASIVTFAPVDSQLASVLLRSDVDGVVPTVLPELIRFVRNQIASSDHLMEFGQAVVQAA